jgi:hypothetical protein
MVPLYDSKATDDLFVLALNQNGRVCSVEARFFLKVCFEKEVLPYCLLKIDQTGLPDEYQSLNKITR